MVKVVKHNPSILYPKHKHSISKFIPKTKTNMYEKVTTLNWVVPVSGNDCLGTGASTI